MAKDKQLGVRVDADLVRRLDAYADKERRARPGLAFTRTDAVNVLLNEGLARHGFPAADVPAGVKKGEKAPRKA